MQYDRLKNNGDEYEEAVLVSLYDEMKPESSAGCKANFISTLPSTQHSDTS
jgi:hypothetical protein